MTAPAFGQLTVVSQGGPITINDNGPATPYPSTTRVQGTFGLVEKLTVTLTGVSHGYPDDMDMYLEAPDGARASILMSDAGGQFDLVNTTFTLDSTASSALPNEGQINSGGIYRPANYDGNDADLLPAPPTGTSTSFAGGSVQGIVGDLSGFNGRSGTQIEGAWNLFIADDTVIDAGSMRSWALNFYMSPVLLITNTSPVAMTEDSPKTIDVFVNDLDTALSGLTLTATSSDTSIIPNSGLTFGGNSGGTNRTLTLTPAANASGNVTITVTAKDEQNQTFPGVNQQTFTVQVAQANDAPTMILATSSTSVPQGGITTNITIHVRDVDAATPASSVVLTATSSNPAVIPATNVLFTRITSGTDNGTNRVVNIAAGSAVGSSTITIIATDSAGASSTATINVTVNPVPMVVAANPTAIVLPDASGPGTPYPSTITVPNTANLGLVGDAIVSLINVEHPTPQDIGALLVSPSGRMVVLTRGAGGVNPVGLGDANDIRLTFDADATAALSSAQLVTASYDASDLRPGAGNFPGSAPAAPYLSGMSALEGSAAAGTWSLYVYDSDSTTPGGKIAGGWVLEIFSAPIFSAIGNQTTAEDTVKTVTFQVADLEGSVTNVTAQLVNSADVGKVTLATTLSGSTGTLTITPAANFNTGTPASPIQIALIAMDNSGGYTSTNTFSLTVTPVNDAPTQSVIAKQVTTAGQSVGPLAFTVGDVETTADNLVVTVTSTNPKLLPPGAIVLSGSGANRTLLIFPAGSTGGQADVIVTVTDTGDGANPATSSTQTFDLTVNPANNPLFENVAGIQVVDATVSGPSKATPYPSTINVSGLQGTIAEVQVALFGITHPQPDDLDIMLSGPGSSPVNLVLMSDAGDSGALNNVTLRFRQGAPVSLADSGQISSGDYLPTDYESGALDFGVSGTPLVNATSLASYIGANPNGDWRLFVVDDTVGPRGGVITSWQLSIRTRPALATIPDQTTPEDTSLRFTVSLGDNQPGVPFGVTASSSPVGTSGSIIQSITSASGQTISGTPVTVFGSSQTFTINPVADASGTNSVTLTFTDPDGFATSRTFNFIVTPVNDAPRFGTVADRTTPTATPTSFSFTVSDPEGTSVAVAGTSSRQDIVPDANIVISPANSTTATRTMTISPIGIASGVTTITLTATDADSQKSSKSFVLTVSPNVSFLNSTPIVINDNAVATPYPSSLEVFGVNGSVSGASVVLVGLTHPFPEDVDVLLVAPDGRSVMLMSDAGGGTAVSNLRLTFSDGGTLLPDETALTSTIYSPANYAQAGEVTEMPSPAPAAPAGGYSTSLASLAGVNPNGQWKLYVRDDTFPDGGQIANGWILSLKTAPTITQVATQTTQEDTVLPVRFTVSDQDTAVTGLTVSYSVQGTGTGFNDPGLLTLANISFVTNSASAPDVTYTLNILPTTNWPSAGPNTPPATNSVTVSVTDGTSTASTTFLVRVLPVDDAPQIIGALAPSPINSTNHVVTTEDSPITIQFTVKDVDSTLGTSSNIVVQSSNPALVPNTTANIVISGADNVNTNVAFNVSVTLTPVANQAGTTTLSFIVTDRSQSVTNQVVLEVTPVNDLPTIAFPTLGTDLSVSVGVGNTVGIPVTVTDVELSTQDILVTATSPAGSQSTLPNANISVTGRGSDRTITVTPTGTVTSPVSIPITVTANDNAGGVSTRVFTVVVTPPPGQVIQNLGTISIPGSGTTGPASPYPSIINVANMIGAISKISVSIDGLTHTAPDDIDMLLVSPTGKKVILMSDAGGRSPISNVQLVFDTTGRALPDEGIITTGNYQPSDYEPGFDVFPSTAPAGPYASSLQEFVGTNPNGTWSLYIVDDAASDVGQIVTGWSLRIETGPSITFNQGLNAPDNVSPTFVRLAEDNTANIVFTINDPVTPPQNLAVSFTSSNPGVLGTVVTNWLSVGSGNNSAVIQAMLVPSTNAFGTNNLTIVVRRNDGAQSSIVVPMDVTPANDAPIISRLINRSTQADTPLTVPLAITDVDTALTSIWVLGRSDNENVIPSVNVLIAGRTNVLKGLVANASSGSAFPVGALDTWTNLLTIVPKPAAFSSTPVSITIEAREVDKDGNTVGTPTTSVFSVTVTPVNHAPTVSTLPALVAVEAGKSTTNIVFSVADPDADSPLVITATSSDQALVRDQDIVIDIPSGSAGSRTVRVTTQPGVTGDATITLRVADPAGARGVGQFVVRLTPTRERVFANRTPVTIRDNNSADPYPSQITVSGFSGNISRVTVTLTGFWHTFPDDVDMLLVSPAGQKVILMSDAGGGTPVPSTAALNVKFDDSDADAVPVPDNTPLAARTYKVANYEGTATDDFSNRTPAGPAGPYAEALSAFHGSSPNGIWSLYVLDDTPSDSGAITNGWSLGITTLPGLNGLADVVSPEDVPARVSFSIAEESFANPANFTFAVASSNPALVPASLDNIVISGTGTNRTVTVIPTANANTNNAGASALITLTEQTTGVTGSFHVTFVPVNDAPIITAVQDQAVPAGTFINIPNFNYSDVETAKKDLVVTITSSDSTVIPAANVLIAGTDLRVFAGTQSGTARITITVLDKGDGINPPQSSSMSFNVTVAAGFNAVASNNSPITINDNARANPYPSTIDMRGVNGTVQKVTITLTGFTHPFPDDVDVLLVGPNGQSVVLMSDAGAGGNAQTALNNSWLIFDDSAPDSLPDNAPITPFNAYKPTNYEVSNSEFLAPAPAGPYSATLGAAFANINPNGTWSLYVQDDASPDAGSIAGWVLNVALNEVGPTLAGLVDTNAVEDAFVSIPFTVGSATLNDVSFVTSASNSNLVSSIKVGGSGADRSLQITLVPNATGSSQITVSASDATGTRIRQFLLTVANVNDLPVFAAVPDLRIVGPTNVVLNITDPDTALDQLVFFAATSGVGLINDVQFTVSGGNVVAHITPATGSSGTEVLTVTVSDGSGSVSQSFNVTVVPQGPPAIAPIADVATAVGRSVSVPLQVSDTDTPIDELVFFASSSGTALVSDVRFDLTASNTVVMTITPTAGQAGTERITVSVSDGTTTTRAAFNFTVAPPAPVILPIANQTISQNASLSIPVIISDSDTPFNQLVLFASTTNPNLVRDVTFITVGTNVTATLNLVANASGTADVTFTVSDGASSSSSTFHLVVTTPCVPPTLGAIASQTATGSSIVIPLTVTDPNDPLTNLTFQAATVGNNIVSGASFSTSGGAATATLTLFPNATGNEQVTITVSDGCGSSSQTFTLTTGGATNGAPTISSTRNGTNLVLTVTGTVGASYVIEGTSNLATWSVVDTVTIGANGTAQLVVPTTGTARFFRVRAGSGALAAQKKALLVVGNATLVAGDITVSNRLAGLGYSLTVKSAPSTVTADAVGNDLVVVSSTISSGDVAAKFQTSNVPVVHWETALQDDFLATGNVDGTDRGSLTNQTQLNILATSSPLAAGLSAGIHTVASTAGPFNWGTPQSNVVKIATLAGDTNKVAIYGYDAGAATLGTNKAPARRVMLFMGDTGLSGLTAEGIALFDAAINWAVAKDVTRPGDAVLVVSGTNDADTSAGAPPAAEGVEHTIDNAPQKYLNFLDLGSGFIVTPSIGRTLVTGVRLWTANDAPERDPASYKIEGSLIGPNGPFTTVSEGALSLPTTRNGAGTTPFVSGTSQVVEFANTTAYTSYRVTFPTLRDAATANSMQIAEVDLLGRSE